MREYEDLVGQREDTVDGIGPWYWLKSDDGAWTGPKKDWEEHHSKKWFEHVRDFSVCFQAGACLGMYPRLLSSRFSRVYSFEPDRLNFYVANLNCQLDNVHLFNAAVGESSGTWTGILRANMSNVGMHKTGGMGPIPIMTIDSLGLQACGLIALDIEGYEQQALMGALETLKKFSPVVVCECPSQGSRAILTDLGYVQEEQSVSDAVFVKS